jgi:hypothetical protein
MELAVLKFKMIMQGILISHPHEIGCADCYQHIDAYVELVLDGENAAQVYPRVHEHLQRCRNCQEELTALISALRGFDQVK